MTGEPWLILPTYNEAENVEQVTQASAEVLSHAAGGGFRVLVVDDGSPDGTGEIADRLAAEHDWLEVLHRSTKNGIGPAYLAGFRHALERGAGFVSEGGSAYARIVLGLQVRDLTGGFKCFRREVLEAIHFEGVRSRGYAFQVELTYRAVRAGFRVVEVPITFRDRQRGKSKMSWRIAAEAMVLVPKLRFR
jgi:dolichol-phosphate mannosyltransferase